MRSRKKFSEGYRDPARVKQVASTIGELSQSFDEIKIIHLCGTHEYSIVKNGLRSLLPKNVKLIPGPGCPVCVTPAGHIDAAVELTLSGVEILTFGDMFKVPGSKQSLEEAKADGGRVEIVYGLADAISIAQNNTDRNFVFFAIGFETTSCTTAAEVYKDRIPENLTLLVSHRLMPPITEVVVGMGNLPFLGLLCPGHVSTIIGAKPWRIFPEAYQMPTVVAGFEPLDILTAIRTILEQARNGEAELVNEYKRAVRSNGNTKAKEFLKKVFKKTDGHWRGIGTVPSSAYELREEFKNYDAAERYGLHLDMGEDIKPGCRCHHVIIGRAVPTECPMFLEECTPSSPFGPCMVSSEGACSVWAKHGGSIDASA
ncbi:hypothetical protein AKJ41_02785 [candidate division MSBL1 archaeon SCGC-AAA259O05]|uniref:Hydrogenase assembly protein HupF n=1 Tax=candidate division MSBL1 archaeon SCGC-AAA259O05 TaxID=1698271 RepID=A0A133V3R1_9EURY|nr:hypothetical protein AKJ41_02785 [candidate division MSBL1 archaeon SCGC-AAA259O05]